jgi:serine/threonine protein kinase
MQATPPRNVACFGPFRLNLKAGELHRANGEVVRLQEQPFQVLKILLEHPGEVVTRGELRRILWPNDTIVEFDQSINATIKKLRSALEDSAENPRYIETVARRGYRLIVTVEWPECEAGEGKPTEAERPAERTPADGNLIGKKVLHYRVLQVLGGGGMGVVYAAEDLKLGRRVALKFLPEELAHDATAMQRFEREARAASALNHPNVCTIYEIEEHEGQPFIVMELLEGMTLREMVSAAQEPEQAEIHGGGAVSLQRLLNIAIQAADGLDAAHKRGIIHRDIKPANIFVTHHEQAKILDFGLAKLQHSDGADIKPETLDEHNRKGEWNPLLTLTRTGTTVGTAAYMSPEQVLCENLDARTDLFSFGLVLYEMATRQRAFAGDTAPELYHAILNQAPTPPRQLNPRIPGKLESIIGKAIEKDRTSRYQSAAEIRADLEDLRSTKKPLRSRWVAIVEVAVAAVFILTLGVWYYARRPQQSHPSAPAPELKLRQLTTNPPENPLSSGTISPDGKYLVYGDRKGMHVKLIETGETRSVPAPPELNGKAMDWNVMQAWLADGTHFLANAHPPGEFFDDWTSEGTSIWIGSVLAGPPRKFRDQAIAFGVSPDGLQIAFGTNRRRDAEREVRVAGPNGEGEQEILRAKGDEAFLGFNWTPTSDRMFYIEEDSAGDAVGLARDVRGGAPTMLFSRPELAALFEMVWLHDGRLVYAVREPGARGDVCNYWVRRIDWHTGKRLDEPKRLTNWTGFCPSNGSVTADDKRLAFLGWTSRFSVYLEDVEAGGATFRNPRQFTLDESNNVLLDWTADSKSVIFSSDRSGAGAIYRQALNEDTPELIVRQSIRSARAAPDGKWLVGTMDGSGAVPNARNLVRAPISGGAPETLFPVSSGAVALCPKSPSATCVVAERSSDLKQMIITAFDPTQGRGNELLRFTLDPRSSGACGISADGTRIAAITGPTNRFWFSHFAVKRGPQSMQPD